MSSNPIYTTSKPFRPTYLYIKQHSVTGKLYFGKTIKDPETYKGSGSHWVNHIKAHGEEYVVNLWYCLFYDQKECTEFALNFSEQQNIVESTEWLNKTPETGLGGCAPGHLKGVLIGNKNPNYNNTWSEEQKQQLSEKLKGRNKGKTYEEIYGYELAERLKLDRKIATTGKDNNGKKNPRALRILAISPNNEEFIIEGDIANFCKEHELGESMVRRSYQRNTHHHKGWKFVKLGSVF